MIASRILRPVPRLHSCLTRLGLSASMAAEAIRARRTGEDQSGLAREILRAAFQDRHATAHWLPYNRRAVGAWWRVGAPESVGASSRRRGLAPVGAVAPVGAGEWAPVGARRPVGAGPGPEAAIAPVILPWGYR